MFKMLWSMFWVPSLSNFFMLGKPLGPLILFLVQPKNMILEGSGSKGQHEYNKSSYTTVAYKVNFIIIDIFYGPIDNL